ncbi:universal stress protein [Haloarcula sp. NS06]|uniref:universal stress protein n=1 Tax=unclassified Haloarcula TaxID=2624677 RepID=UPI00359CB249
MQRRQYSPFPERGRVSSRSVPTTTERVDAVTEVPADLVVMGTHGRTGLDHYLIGSVAETVVRESPVPVLTVQLSEE